MKIRTALVFLLIVLIHFAASASPAMAAKSKKPPAAPPDTRKLITAINLKTDAIVIADKLAKTKHTYVVDLMTKVQVGNLPGGFTDLKVGMTVDDLMERDNDTLDSITVDADFTPSTPVKKKKT